MSKAGGDVVADLQNVSRVYQMGGEAVHALRDFSFQFKRGEYWAIMGTSGSGKSTLLNLLGCIDRPTSGTYSVRGQEISGLNDNELSALRGRVKAAGRTHLKPLAVQALRRRPACSSAPRSAL